MVFVVKGSGIYDVGNSVRNKFSALLTPTELTCNVLPGKSLKIYSDNITYFTVSNQPLTSIYLHNAKTLEVLELVDCVGLDGDQWSFNASILPNLTRLRIYTYFNFVSLTGVQSCRNLKDIFVGQGFSQAAADSVVSQIIQAKIYNGLLTIRYQDYGPIPGGMVNITGAIYNTLRNTYGWTVN
jgi:hypothetical protein